MTFTAGEKLACVKRELRVRRRLYDRFVSNRSMSQEEADLEIALMEVIEGDYLIIAAEDAAKARWR